ncbi:MAG TPA: tRNA (adenosine(37)-N6)-threonylcarbamoyltransferase complex dimerization subunit type 1 TsaB [Geopsychrobacteraceae bacterium]|nr:tRNA (adenosine(37)-N6)-threonylcarbamoyltransferase complex dimerization subunit type 1 TsaB [Geopsychrobacteraceae bacterium]
MIWLDCGLADMTFEKIAKAKILAIDTSSLSGSVALCQDGIILAESTINARSTHSERLLQQVEQVLEGAGITVSDLDLIAVVHGPGSFTGLRVGLATAKGLAVAADLPVVGLSTLEVLAMNLPLCPYPVCAFIDARKGEVYSGLYDCRSGHPVPLSVASVQPPSELLDSLDDEIAFVGDGVSLYSMMIEQKMGGRAKLPPAPAHQLRAAAAAVLAVRKYSEGEPSTVEELVPCYIRPSDADLPRK